MIEDRFDRRIAVRATGLLAQPSNLLRPSYVRMAAEIVRFTREAKALAGSEATGSTAEFLERGGYSRAFRDDFLLPMVACIWSSRLDQMLSYPAATMAAFLDNHGLLDLRDRPQWRTVAGGSREYVRRIEAGLADIRLRTPVASVLRTPDGVIVHTARAGERFDHVVMATHADTTLQLLGPDASADERSVLSSFRYQENRAVLHRDPSLMPVRRRAWSSWNYLALGPHTPDADRRVSLTYWMNRLQNLRTERPVLVTLNPIHEPRDATAETVYHHPQYDGDAVKAQRRIPALQGVDRTWFAGSYTGFGFHEDALRSGLKVAAALGSPAPWWRDEIERRTHDERQPVAIGG